MHKQHIAIPYYGSLTHPQTGLTDLFFIAEVGSDSQNDHNLTLSVWDTEKHPRLSDWLHDQNVSGVICREKDHIHLQALIKEGFWVSGGASGDAEEMFARWFDATIHDENMMASEQRQVA